MVVGITNEPLTTGPPTPVLSKKLGAGESDSLLKKKITSTNKAIASRMNMTHDVHDMI